MSKECIEREAAKRALRIWITGCVLNGDNESADRFRDCIDILDSLDTADVAPVRYGEWIERAWRPTCSLCGFSGSLIDAPISPFKYCPNCGAKMDGGTP
jgi:hypothetical protein